MALRAGRVGVNPADVDAITGHIINNYSEDEMVVGKWIDGSNIYQKTIKVNLPTSAGEIAEELVDTHIDFSDVIDSRIIYKGTDSVHIACSEIKQNMNISGDHVTGVKVIFWKSGANKGKISVYNSVASWSDKELIVTIKYLKED